jgi:hypothetical protein
MDEAVKQFARQAQWQTRRKTLSWPEKVRQAEAMRESIIALRKKKPDSRRSQRAGTNADPAS